MNPRVTVTSERPGRGLLLLALALLLAGAGLRLSRLDGMALFVDEGGHLLAPVDARLRGVMNPIGEYKPGMLWIFTPAAALPFDPLVAARAMAGLAGLATAALLAGVLWRASGAAAALAGLGFWALFPLAVFHERLALLDPFVALFLAAALAGAVAADRAEPTRRLALGVVAGVMFGAAFAVKSSALLALPWLGLVAAAIREQSGSPRRDRRFFAALAAGFLLALAPLGPQLLHLGENTRVLVLPELGTSPGLAARVLRFAAASGSHFAGIVGWIFGYGRWPLAMLVATAAGLTVVHRDRRAAALMGAWLLALAVDSLAYPRPYARYLLAGQLPLALFVGHALTAPWRADFRGGKSGRLLVLAVSAMAAAGWLWADVRLAGDPGRAPIPADEKAQYLTGRWSAAGFEPVISLLRERRATTAAPVVVFAPRYSRPGVYSLLLEARRGPRLLVVPVELGTDATQAVGVIRSVVQRARRDLGPRLGVFVLLEGLRSDEAGALRAIGLRCTPVVDHRHADGVSGFVLFELEAANL